jgi:glycosyltransferase involved in cell wall biosynthesis
LIPRYGATGAAAAQLISVSAMAAVEAAGLRPHAELRVGRAIRICRWPLLAMIAAIWSTRAMGFGWALLAGGIAYLAGLCLIWDRIRPSQPDAATESNPRPRVLMVGAHPTKTLGGISTLIGDILNSRLRQEFEFRHIVSQVDEYARLGKLALAIEALAHFVAQLIRWRPQLVYVHVGGNSSLYRKTVFIALARLAGRRVISHFHAGNFEPYFDRQSAFGRKLILRGLGRSHQFIAVSHGTARMLGKYWPEVETSVVPNGIHTEAFAPARVSVPDTDQTVRLLFVGKMGFLKGEQDLIRALQRIANAPPRCRPQFRLDMLGQLSETIDGVCRESGLRPLIDHLGPVSLDERIAFFARADIFVLPTYAEGMPIAVLEAMAAGLPVITTPVGGIPEIVDDGVEGYLVEPGDVEGLADRIAYLIYDPEQRQSMKRRARAKARQFDWNIVLAQLGMELHQAVNVIRAQPARAEGKG